MLKNLSRDVRTVLVATIVSLVVSAVPVMAAVNYALNVDKVDGKHAVGFGASKAKRAGKLTATNSQGRVPDSDKLDGVASGGFVKPSGTILWNVWEGWTTSTGNITITRNNTLTTFTKTTAGAVDAVMRLRPTIPSALFGKDLRITGVELCYDVGNINVGLNEVDLSVNESTIYNQVDSSQLVALDTTVRDSSVECRLYTGTPRMLGSHRYPELDVEIGFVQNAVMFIERTTFVLEATNSPTT